eukprot:746561-Ditylum_brightwellii.AAC.1
MYGLPHAGIPTNNLLTKRLATKSYRPCWHTPGLWTHDWRPVIFSLVVDDFSIKYVREEHAHHLLQTLQHWYEVAEDWIGGRYCGITIKWDYENRHIDLSMSGYIQNVLMKFQHAIPSLQQDAPQKHMSPQYGQKIQYPVEDDPLPTLPATKIKQMQAVVGYLLYYTRLVDPTLLVALGTIAAVQNQDTQNTVDTIEHLLGYCTSHPDAVIRYCPSGMILRVHSNASYLSKPKARIRAGGYFYLGNIQPHHMNGP